jgi:AcrR family transcriptional regulator
MAHRVGLDVQSVIQAAADLADAEGIEAVTLATLAARLGIRAPTLYHYVNGLDGLRRDIGLLGKRELAHVLGIAIMGRSGDEAVEAIAVAYRTFAHAHPGLYAVSQRTYAPEDRAMLEAETEVLGIISRVIAPSEPERDEYIHMVRLLRSMLHGFVSLERDSGFGLPQDINETFRRLVTIIIQITRQSKQVGDQG